jgi:hypothetical protein
LSDEVEAEKSELRLSTMMTTFSRGLPCSSLTCPSRSPGLSAESLLIIMKKKKRRSRPLGRLLLDATFLSGNFSC